MRVHTQNSIVYGNPEVSAKQNKNRPFWATIADGNFEKLEVFFNVLLALALVLRTCNAFLCI